MKFLSGRKSFTISLFFSLILCSCYSVFSGGTGGLIVDAESTSEPKEGIANVDVYAYTNEFSRESDFRNWKEGTLFNPSAEYYGHTTTDNSGNFVLSKLVWKSYAPDFWKDADIAKIYLIFYHENYGLTKSETLIVSDSTSDTVYTELTPIRKKTALNIKLVDVTSYNQTTVPMYVTVTVPEATDTNPDAKPRTYETTITGTGTINIDYPRWMNEEDKSAGKENTPSVIIKYFQSAEEIEWKGCYNRDNEEKNFAFRSDAETGISKQIKNKVYELTFYGKTTRLSIPTISGQYICKNTEEDDGVIVSMKAKGTAQSFSIDCGEVTTASQAKGNTSEEKHGVFSGLGDSCYWHDETYKDKYGTTTVLIQAGNISQELTVRSDVSNYTVQLGSIPKESADEPKDTPDESNENNAEENKSPAE